MIRDAKFRETYVRDLLEAMPDASFLVDSSGRIVLVNALAEKMFGYSSRELPGRNIGELIPERFRGVHQGHCVDYFARPRARPMGVGLSLRGLRKDGAEIPVEISLSPIQTDEGTFVLGAVRDISQSEERYRAIFVQVAAGVVHSNPEGQFLDVNPKFCEISGYSRAEALALDIRRVTHPEDLPKSVEARARMLEGVGPDHEREVRLVRKDGTQVWTRATTSLVRGADGRSLHFISLVHDISAQKRAEQERRETELRFRQVTENMREVFWLTDPAKNEILYVSPAYEAIWGRSARAVYSSPQEWLDAIHPEDRGRVLDAALTKQAAGDYDVEYRIVRPDGEVRWIRDRAVPVHDEERRVVRVAGIAEDITERKRAADDLQESEQRFSRMLQRVELVALMLDRDACITYCNDYLLRLTGWTREEVSGGNWFELFLPSDNREELRGVFASLLADLPVAWHYENEIVTRSGERRRIRWSNTLLRSSSGEVVGTASIGEDITERKRAESELQESEARFRAMIEQSISGTCIIDADRRFAYVNPRLVAILGYESDAAVTGRPVLEFVAPEDRARVTENMRQRMSGEAQSARYHFQAIRRDGSRVTLGAHGTMGMYGGKRVLIATVQDVTELRRAEEEIERTVAKLRRAVQSTIEVVSAIGELRDPYTHGHEHRVGEIAIAIATEMDLPADRVEGIRVAGYLHDVGKIAVPAEILAKPAKLTSAEFELVKQHAQQSYEILKGVEFPWPVGEAAWQHHERLDGSGYPRGLKAEAIILEARILAVADTVEAMASHRPYRAGLGIEAALAEIERSRGTHFDTAVVDACLRLFRLKGYRLPA
jgi:PAS domain S-box-containing protein